MNGPSIWSEHPGDDDSYSYAHDDPDYEGPYERFNDEDHSFGDDERESYWDKDADAYDY